MTTSWDRLLTGLIVLFTISCTVADNGTDDQRSNGPKIIPQVKEKILQKGDNFTMTCKGKADIYFKQQEIPEEVTGNFRTKQRKSLISEGEYKYEVVLELYNVDQFAIGYYGCFDNSVSGGDVLNYFTEEPSNTEHVSYIYIYVDEIMPPPPPKISGGPEEFLKGETFSLNCTVEYKSGSIVMLHWEYPSSVSNDSISAQSNGHDHLVNSILYRNLTVTNAKEEHNGTYVCVAQNNVGQKKAYIDKIYRDKPYINITNKRSPDTMTTNEEMAMKVQTVIEAYPAFNYYFLRNNAPIFNNTKYIISEKYALGGRNVILLIKNCKVSDNANYTLVITNEYNMTKSLNYILQVNASPIIVSFGSKDVYVTKNTTKSLSCSATGFPLPIIKWLFTEESNNTQTELKSTSNSVESVYQTTANLDMQGIVSGNITCIATNKLKSVNASRRFLIYEVPDGFGIKNSGRNWYSENEDIILTCVASKYDFDNVTWFGTDDKELKDIVTYSTNSISLVASLTMYQVSPSDSGNYTCRAIRNDGVEEEIAEWITVLALNPPTIMDPKMDKSEEVYRFLSTQFPCLADGVPPPKLEWYKDGVILKNNTKTKIYMNTVNRTSINSTIVINKVQEEDKGTYECVVTSNGQVAKRTYTLALKAEATNMTFVGVIIAIIFSLILLVAYLTWKIKKEKQFKRELAAAGLFNFKKGVTKSLNPDLGIDEQAELLPYDEKFEFPAEKLKLGKQLGAGAFGVVYKAEARGIINAEETTEVAVKMVKKTADNMYIKALASELKIMVHLGKHINIVNLLGACTKNVGKRELIVIVEYCKFGNIHNYMQRHREVFIDQLTDNKEKNLGRVNRGFSYSSGSTGAQSDYFSANNTQDTDNTFLNTANTNRSGRKVSEGYVQPEWRTNYESDYSFDGRNPRPLTSRDLLVWAFQIARGMEYLANRKVLHGDLAARNVLLADDNIVKICDFGLARSIYNNDEYQKKENSLLPLKWLAIECMTDRIFSTQSDVWSFGIVLWEMFSLAKTPYPNISPASLLQWLSEGNRLAKPTYADDKLYNVMMKCWEQKPTARPSFSQLQEILGGFLEDNVRNHYVDLNSAYADFNVKAEGQEDYLAMVCAPDYNNLVTPSPHHYANESNFFPRTPTQLDEEGYLQMSPASKQVIFSPRPQDAKFDFDARKFNPRVSEASSGGSELTPMLTLNNLPRSSSESDHEGNVSPYLNKCTSIKEEADEVFETKQNNAKNSQNTAVTNPTYITFDAEIEKKPKDIINNYINVPNGLVK